MSKKISGQVRMQRCTIVKKNTEAEMMKPKIRM